jgi:O-antigen/teichoic acid export membrane protein
MSFIIMAFAQAWSPFALRMYGEDPNYLHNWSRVFSGWFFALALAGLGLALFAPEMMRILTPPEYWPAARILALASIGLVFYGTVQLTVLGISIAKRTVLITYGAWMAAGANILLNLALIPWLGALGAAIANLLSYVVLTGAFLFWSQKLHPMPLERAKLFYSLIVVGFAVAAVAAMDLIGIGVVPFLVKGAILVAAIVGAFAFGILDRRLYQLVLRHGATTAAEPL